MSSSSKPKVLLLGEIDQYVFHFINPLSTMVLLLLIAITLQIPTKSQLTNLPSQPSKDAFNSLSSIAELITPKSTNREDFIKECRSGAFRGVKAAYRTFNSVSITGKFEGEVCEVLGKKGAGLKYLAHNGG